MHKFEVRSGRQSHHKVATERAMCDTCYIIIIIIISFFPLTTNEWALQENGTTLAHVHHTSRIVAYTSFSYVQRIMCKTK